MAAIPRLYRFSTTRTLALLWQTADYRAGAYLRQYWSAQDIGQIPVGGRRLERLANFARVLLLAGMVLQLSTGLGLLLLWYWQGFGPGLQFGLALVLSYPLVWAHLVVVPVVMVRMVLLVPSRNWRRRIVLRRLARFSGPVLIVVGEFDGAQLQNLLAAAMGNGLRVASSPSDRGTLYGHARWSATIAGNDICILRLGPKQTHDVVAVARQTRPAYMCFAGSNDEVQPWVLQAALQAVGARRVLVAAGDRTAKHRLPRGVVSYRPGGALGWQILDYRLVGDHVTVNLRKRKRQLELTTGVVGRHMVAPLLLTVALALKLGMSERQLAKGVAACRPLPHCLELRRVGRLRIIDDMAVQSATELYAGVALMAEIEATQRWYVGGGLAATGNYDAKLHHALGERIAAAKPVKVILVDNAVKSYIIAGLTVGGYDGEIISPKDITSYLASIHPADLDGPDLLLVQAAVELPASWHPKAADGTPTSDIALPAYRSLAPLFPIRPPGLSEASVIITRDDFINDPDEWITRVNRKLHYPLRVAPTYTGSHVSCVTDPATLRRALGNVLEQESAIVVDELPQTSRQNGTLAK